jgi:hypothetical protein
MATVKQGQDPAKVEKIIDEELDRLIKQGPTAAELERAKTGARAGFIRGIERIGGFGGKADALAECAVFTGDPGCFRTSLANIEKASAADLSRLGAQWLDKGSHTLVIAPGERVALKEDPSQAVQRAGGGPQVQHAARAGGPQGRRAQTRQFPQLKFPALQRATLKNGTQVILAEREIPVVQFSYQFPGGFSADQGRKPGTANFTMSLLTEGAGKLGSLAFADAVTPGRQPGCLGRPGLERGPVGAEGKPGTVAGAVPRPAARAALRAGRDRPGQGHLDRRHPAGEGQPGCGGDARAAAAAVRQGPPVCHSVHRQR